MQQHESFNFVLWLRATREISRTNMVRPMIGIDNADPVSALDRREDSVQWRAKVEQRLDDGAATMRTLQEGLQKNTEATERVEGNTSEVVDLLRSFQGAFKVLNMIGKLAKPLGYIVMACSAVLALWHALNGGAPPK